MEETFSTRFGFASEIPKEITIREEAPIELRGFIRMAFYDLDKKEPSELRNIICRVLRVPPNHNNWSNYPNIDIEVGQQLETCNWYFVYDIIEKIIQSLNKNEKPKFINDVNQYFIKNGIGWKIVDDQLVVRGDEQFEEIFNVADATLKTANLTIARTELKEARTDLSRRPMPDITGAIQHSQACLEYVARECLGDTKSTLGKLINENPDLIPKPLNIAIHKMWGFASENGRHLKSGQMPEYDEAELILGITASITAYLGKKFHASKKIKEEFYELPF